MGQPADRDRVNTGRSNKADILQRNATTKTARIWFIDGLVQLPWSGTVVDPGGPEVTIGSNWAVVGTGDFDNDGFPDILWRHATNRKYQIWFMAVFARKPGSGFIIKQDGSTKTMNPAWSVAGTGDFDADGYCDILLRNTNNGNETIWLMQDRTKLDASGSIPN